MSKGSRGAPRASSKGQPRRTAGQQPRPHMSAQELASEREALWDASALSPAALPEAAFSPGVRAALEQIFGPQEQTRLGRVAEQGVTYKASGAANTGGELNGEDGLAALATQCGVTPEELAARLDLPVEFVRARYSDCPPALLAEVAQVLRAPLAEVAQALRASSDAKERDQARTFVETISMAPSLSDEQRRHWLAILAADPA
jgi:hypothetical protein